MQIRKQLRNLAVATTLMFEKIAPVAGFNRTLEYPKSCCFARTCPNSYHGMHVRVRFKSRARHHGTKTNAGKKSHG